MSRKIWFYLFIGVLVLFIIQSMVGLWKEKPYSINEKVSLQEAVNSFHNYPLEAPKEGYICDAETAAKIGSAISDAVCRDAGKEVLLIEEGIGGCSVDYDSTLRIWRVAKGYFNHRGAVVYLNQDTGEVVYWHFQK